MTRIEPGQIYRFADPREDIVIKVLAHPVTTPGLLHYGKVQVASLGDDGRQTRARHINCGSLHPTPLTRDGQPRRTGYILDQPEPANPAEQRRRLEAAIADARDALQRARARFEQLCDELRDLNRGQQ